MPERTLRDTVSSIVLDILEDNIRLSMPAKVVSVAEYEASQAIDVQPLVNNLYKDNVIVEYPVIYRVPVVLLGGGGALISVPIKVGDLVKIEFSRDSLQEFLQSDGAGSITPEGYRRYALTDAIATPAFPTRQKNLHHNPNDLEVKLTDSVGQVVSSIKLKPNGDVTLDAAGNLIATANGNCEITSIGTCDLTANIVNVYKLNTYRADLLTLNNNESQYVIKDTNVSFTTNDLLGIDNNGKITAKTNTDILGSLIAGNNLTKTGNTIDLDDNVDTNGTITCKNFVKIFHIFFSKQNYSITQV